MLKKMRKTLLAAAVAGNVGAAAAATVSVPMSLQDYLALHGPAPTAHVA